MIDDIEQHIYMLIISIYKLFWEIFRHVYWKDIIEVDLRRLLQKVNLFKYVSRKLFLDRLY